MIETSHTGRRAVIASAGVALTCLGLCGFGGTTAVPGGLSATVGANTPTPLEWSVSPDGEWLAVSASRGRKDQYDAWLVSIDDGASRELTDVERVSPQLGFDAAGRLRLYLLDDARGLPSLVWTDPRSGDVLESTRDRARIRRELEPLAHGWARLDERKIGDVTHPRKVEWPAQRLRFELDSKRDGRLAVSDIPGIVFYSRKIGDQLRLVRRDMRTENDTTLVAEGRGLAEWSVASDGREIAVVERVLNGRVRVIDAATGSLVAGPWTGDEVEWLEGAESRYLAIRTGDQRLVVDTLRDKLLPTVEWRQIRALDDGSFVVEQEQQIVHFDMDFGEPRVLFQRAVDSESNSAGR